MFSNISVFLVLLTNFLFCLAEIQPGYQSIIWKQSGIHYFTPLTLNTSAYALASPAGVLPDSLNKRSSHIPSFLPCTVITLNSSTPLKASSLEAIISQYKSIDDVWTPEFLESVFIQYDGPETGVAIDKSVEELFSSNSVKYAFISNAYKHPQFNMSTQYYPTGSGLQLTNGPYVASLSACGQGLGLTPAYQLKVDDYEAFMSGSIPSIDNSHLTLHVSIPGTRLPAIIAPSRLASTSPDPGPLTGLRFAVKDIFHIKGLKTSGGSRSYYETYSAQNYTTETVNLCLGAGASLVGKTRTIAFALGAPRNGQEVDFLNPWSARGDGYQDTGGSSSGSGAAVTAYDWIDFALGSDTGGSVRFPARYGGFYGYKPTHGIFNITGILVAIAEQDTPGFMARSPKIFTKLGNIWAKNHPLAPLPQTLPKNLLLYTDEDPLSQPAAEALKQEFFTNITTFFNLTTSSINVTATFIASNISETSPALSQSDYMFHVYADQNSVEGWDEIGAPLTELYKSLHNGASPPAGDPPVNISWTDGQNTSTRARFPESQRRRAKFGDWWNSEVVKSDNITCSESIFAHSYHTPPSLSKVSAPPAELTVGWYNGVAINYAGSPEIVVPIGQVEYLSPYTLTTELQPVTVALSVAKGCDLVLFEIVDRLAEAGLLKETLPGKTAYPV